VTREERNTKIIELYHQGFNSVQIAERVGVHNTTVQRFLRKQGLPLHKTEIPIPTEVWEDIVQRFQSGEKIISIYRSYQQFFGCPETLSHRLERRGVKTKKLVGTGDLPINHDFFHNIQTEVQAYYLGMLISDGSVADSGSISIELHEEDRYIVEEFRQALDSEHAITSTRSCVRFAFRSHKIAQDLTKYGVVPRKTDRTYLPSLDRKFMPHLIRGVFDGDGTVYRRKDNDGKLRLSFGFYGSEKLLVDIRQFLHEEIGMSIKNKIQPKIGCFMLYYGHRSDIRKFYDYIYGDANFYLKRKRNVFEDYFADTERAVISSPCNA
jgi:hypothetical protein